MVDSMKDLPPNATQSPVPPPAQCAADGLTTMAPLRADWTRLLAWLPIPLLLAVIAGLWVADLRTAYESRTLMVLLNLFFTWLASLCICFLTARAFLGSSRPGLLMFGCGSLLWGVTSLAAAVIVERVNPTVTVHNVGVLGAALCHLVGSLWRGRLPRPGKWLVQGYACALMTAALIVWAAMAGWTPVFFVQGRGGTPLRQAVLFSATALFTWVAWQMIYRFRRQSGAFYYWYGLGLALVATGLTGVMLLSVQGGILGWTNRLTQYLGSAYLFMAALVAARQTGMWTLSLTAVNEALQKYWFMTEYRRQQPLQRVLRYGMAVVAVAAGFGLRLALEARFGTGLPAYVTFYPAVMVVALLAGFGPCLVAMVLSVLVVGYWVMPPLGQFAVSSPVDRLGLVIFTSVGLLMGVVAEFHRRYRDKAAAYDREAALRESRREKEFLANLLDHASQPFAVGYPDGRLGRVNRAYELLTGYTTSDLHALDWSTTLTPPEWREPERQKLDELHRTGQPVRYEKEYIRKDGSRVPIELLVHLVRDAQGKPEYYYSFIADITERKRAEEALRKSEQEFRTLTEAMPQIVWATRPDGWNIYFNQQWMDYTGLTLDESYGHGWNIPFHPDDKQRAWDAWQRATQHDEPYLLECRLRRADGVYRWWLIHGTPMRGANGEIQKWFGTCTDIEERKQAEEALRESEERLRLLGDNLPDSAVYQYVHETDGSIRFLYFSAGIERLNGVSVADVLRDAGTLHRQSPPEHLARLIETEARSERDLSDFDMELPMRRSDGEVRWMRLHSRPRRLPEGRTIWDGVQIDVTERKRAEAALRESEEQFRAMFEVASVGIVQVNPVDGRFIRCNDKYCHITGYSQQDLAGHAFRDLTHPDDRETDWQIFSQAARGETANYLNEKRYVRKDGSMIWVRLNAAFIRDAKGYPIRTVAVCEDITERKRAEEVVQRSEALLRAVTDNSPDPIFLKDRDCRLLFANPATLRAIGKPAEEVIGKSDEEFYDNPEVGRAITANDRRIVLSGRDEVVEEAIPRPDGSTRIFLSMKSLFHDAQGQVIGIVGIARDITERKQAEEDLRRKEADLRDAQRVTHVGSWNWDAKTDVTTGSDELLRIYGLDPTTQAMPDFRAQRGRCYPVEEWERVNAAVQRTMQTGVGYELDVQAIHDGAMIWVTTRGEVVRDADGRIVGLRGTVQDITDRKRAEEAIQRAKAAAEAANEAKGQFLANMSHELRTPMNAILGMIDVALPRATDPTVQDCLQTAKGSADLLLTLLNDLLDSAKIESGKLELESAPFSLRRMLDQITRVLAVRASEKGLCFYCRMPDETPDAVVGDRMRVQQVLLNLAGNAIKFTERGDVEIHLHTLSQDGEACLQFAVRDTGIGIPASSQERLFQPFTQADASTTRRFGGTGLGLSICKSLVELMGGRIWVESAVGKGSTFYFTVRLPLAKELPADFDAPVAVPTAACVQLRVLLVEDNPANQKLATYILQDRGHLVEIAGDGQEAICLTEQNHYDVILMDVQMPGMNGLEATAAIRNREDGGKRVPIIAMTAHAMRGDRDRCLAAGMDGYLSKPVNALEMIGLVESLARGVTPAAQPVVATSGPAETANQATAPVFNPEEAIARCFDSEDMVREMIQCFFDEVDNSFPKMRAALEKGDLEEVGRLGHRMKGTVVYLGAHPAKEAALRVERFCKCGGGTPAEAEEAVTALERECMALKAVLAEHPLAVESKQGD
jgi:PAS domain S-box-containing protein